MVYSRTTPFLIALTFLVAPMMANAVVPASTYKAVIGTISDTSYNVTGVAIVFAADDNSTVAYAGIIDGLMPSSSNACIISGDANGCGVHIHAGFSCENDSTLQGDNYFVDPVTQDPWTEERYYYSTSNNSWITGKANFAGLINIGSTSNLNGRAFIVHSENGTRIGCGLLESVTSTDLLITQTRSLTDSGVTADATIYAWNEDTACYFGQAKNLESNLLSVSKGGNDCNAVDGCGTHIHAGSDCFNSTTQEGDYYDQNKVSTDPWAGMGYLSTDSAGVGYFASCVETGATSLVSRAFIVHASNGSRVSCGLLDLVTPNADSVTSTGNPVTAIPDPLNSPATNNTNTADQSSAVAMRMIPTTAATVCAIAVWYVITWQLI